VPTGSKILYESGAGTGNSIYRDPANGNSIFTSAVDFKFANNNATTTYLTLTSSTGAATFSSSVGIGVAPDFPLTIKTDASANSIKIIGRSGGDSLLAFYASNGTTPYLDFSAGATYVNYNAVNSQNYNWYCNSSLKMVLTSGGNVGIGTSSPQLKFVVSNGGAQGFEINSNSGAYAGGVDVICYNRSTSAYAPMNFDASQITFATNAAGERMRITSAGNVGIGSTAPDQKLTIQAAGTANGLISFKNSAGTTTNLIGQPNAAGDVISTSGTDDLCFRTQNGNMLFALSNIEFARFTPGGSLLINTTSDGGKLVSYSTTAATQIKAAGTAPAITFSNTVLSPTYGGVLGTCTSANQFLTGTSAGDMVLANQFSGYRVYVASYSGGVYLSSGATSWTANSDIRLKNINSHIENAVEKLSTLQTINFSYKDDKTNKQNLGLIAQEVKEIIPEAVSYKKSYIPNIYEIGSYDDGLIVINKSINNILNVDDKLKIYDDTGIEELCNITEIINHNSFKIDNHKLKCNKVLVYGTEVDDFNILDKEMIFTLNISATQRLYEKITELENRIKQLEDHTIIVKM